MKQVTAGILAHVDAGKTTLSEAMLYKTGEIRKLGRVDHGDSYLDGNDVERNRGITVFSKQAGLEIGDTRLTLLDTPGHVDFSAEMERVLAVIDYALLIISATDGVQSHTETLWRLLEARGIPVFVFINKMDLAIREKSVIIEELTERFGDGFVDFSQNYDSENFLDDITLAVPEFVDKVLEGDGLEPNDITDAIRERRIFPCCFGSALKVQGVDEFMECLDRFMVEPEWDSEFGARVFKITRDNNDERLTFLKVTGGKLTVRELISGVSRDGEAWSEKVNQIRVYSGMKFQSVDHADAGMVCAVTGFSKTLPGDALGSAEQSQEEVLEPFLSYVVRPLEQIDVNTLLRDMKKLAEEDPKLHVSWNPNTSEIGLRLMGEVQLEIITGMIRDRFGYEVELGNAKLVYKETITDIVEGVGHFEPLRHYAEVHLIMEPGERGSGIVVDSILPEDILLRNWQRLILTHLEEKEHVGVLIGAPITDIKITLAAGRAHDKHTNGGDFREATYRAIRNGLMKANSKLLEPWFSFRIDVPSGSVGRVMTDIEQMSGKIKELSQEGDWSVVHGEAPASTMLDYPKQLTSFTSGVGRMSMQLLGYDACPNQKEVVAASGYDPCRDTANSPDSVFVSHTGSDIVPWDQVEKHMHLPYVLKAGGTVGGAAREIERQVRAENFRKTVATDEELARIFERTFGANKNQVRKGPIVRTNKRQTEQQIKAQNDTRNQEIRAKHAKAAPSGGTVKQKPIVLIDGYNLINFWKEMSELAAVNMGAARDQLIEKLIYYRGYMNCDVSVVFDAYKVPFGIGSTEDHFGLKVIYTAEDEPADIRIGKLTDEYFGKRDVRVVSSDMLVQQNVLGHGAMRVSSGDFVREFEEIQEEIRHILEEI